MRSEKLQTKKAYDVELKSIMLIEDDEDYSFLEKDIIEEELGATVSKVPTLEDLKISHLDLYDLFILDYNLPDATGTEILKIIRLQTDAPVIIVTGQNEIQTAIETLKSGANDYLIKTPELIQLLPTVIIKVFDKYKEQKNLERRQREADLAKVKIETLGQTLTTLAHYINNSTTTIFGYAQLCNQYPDSLSKARKLTKISLKETERITRVLQALDKIVTTMNIRTTNYVNIPDAMFAIEEEIKKQMTKES